jgi:hypothetical protein
MSYTRLTPSLEGLWECHECKREVNSSLNGTTCPQCLHTRCDSCKSPPPGPEPIRDYGINYDAGAYYDGETLPAEGSSRESYHSKPHQECNRRHKTKQYNQNTYERRQTTQKHHTHQRGLQSETYYVNSDEFRQYTKFPTGDMYYCCSCTDGTIYGSGSCPCGHTRCSNCTRAN